MPTIAPSLVGQFGYRRRIVLAQIGNAQAAAEVDGGDLRGLVDPELGDDVAQQADDAVGGEFEAGDVEDLRSDVAVQPDQAQVVGGEHPAHRVHGRAAGQRQAELLVLVGGGDELVGVRLDADGDADQDVLDDPGLPGDGVEPLDLGHRVQHDVTDAGLDRGGQLGDRFVVAVQRDSLGGKSGVQRDGELTAGARRPATALPRRPSGRSRCTGTPCRRSARWRPPPNAAAISRQRERKSSSSMTNSGVPYSWASSVTGTPATLTLPRRRRESCCAARRSAPGRSSSSVDLRPRRAAAVMDLLGVPGAGRVGVHIRSGAETPRMPRPLAITWRVASHSASRAVCSSLGSSSPCGSTRHES